MGPPSYMRSVVDRNVVTSIARYPVERRYKKGSKQLNSMLLLESCLQTCAIYTIVECTVNKLLMMDRGTVRNM